MNRPVGYKRQPTPTQFKPGKSGNPRGRPRAVRNFKADLLDELREQTTIRENGLDQQISKQRAFVKVLVAAAIKGDMRATNTLVSFCTRALGGQPDAESRRRREPTTSTSSKITSPGSVSGAALKRRKPTEANNKKKRMKTEWCGLLQKISFATTLRHLSAERIAMTIARASVRSPI
jgi:hypothetical protein